MKVALDAGDVLDVALVDGDRIIGTLSLQIKGLAGVTAKSTRTAAAAAGESAGAGATTRKRKTRKPLSAEAKARMAAAQKARWEKRRAESGQSE